MDEQVKGSEQTLRVPHWLLAMTLKVILCLAGSLLTRSMWQFFFQNLLFTITLMLVVQLMITLSQFVLVLLYKQWIWIFVMLVCNLLLVHWLRATRRLIMQQKSARFL